MNVKCQVARGLLYTAEEGIRLSKIFHYPLIIRPFCILNAPPTHIVNDAAGLVNYLENDICHFDHAFPLILERCS